LICYMMAPLGANGEPVNKKEYGTDGV
jgi:hypothetical protein